jgi:hypothetical protein
MSEDQRDEDSAFGAAWRRCQTDLPEGWMFYRLECHVHSSGKVTWEATASRPRDGGGWDWLEARDEPTPLAALIVLAEKIEVWKATNG